MAVASALIAGATAIGGAVIGSRAAGRSAQAVTDASDQQVALAQNIYNDQRALNQPFYESGVAANNAAAELLGLDVGGTQAYSGANALGGASSQYANYLNNNPDLQNWYNTQGIANSPHILNSGGDLDGNGVISQAEAGQYHYNTHGRNEGRSLTPTQTSGGTGGNSQLHVQPDGSVRPGAANALTNDRTDGGAAASGSYGYAAPQSTGNRQLDALQTSPGYQFRMQEGMNALETGAAARGGILSGGHIRGATRYAQNYASNEYNNRFNQLQAHAGGGQTAAANNQNAGNALSSTTSNALTNTANAQSNAAQQRGSIYTNALGTVGGIIAGQF